MKTTVGEVDDVTVRLTVEVEPERVRRAFDRAAKKLAERVDVPGFRPGKVPRRLLEQRFGTEAIAQQAIEESLDDFYVEALEDAELQPVGRPEVDMETFDEEEGCVFEATVEVRPEFDAPDHEGISVTFPEWDVSDEDVRSRLETMRERFVEVEAVDRAADFGDYVTMDLRVAVDGEELEGARVEDAMYEVGSGGVTEHLDDELVGREAGDDFTYTDPLPDGYPEHGGEEAELTVTVKDVRHKNVPDLDDEFALTASEFDTIEELRKDIRDSLLRRSISEARSQLRDLIVEAYLANVDIPLPPSMVESEVEDRLHRLEYQAEQYGMEVEELLSFEDTTREEFEEDARTDARSSVKARLVLDELARALDFEVSDQDLADEISHHAEQQGTDPQDIAQRIQQQGSIGVLVGDILRRKAIDALMDAAEIEGGPTREVLVELGLEAPDEEHGDTGEPGDTGETGDLEDTGQTEASDELVVPGSDGGEPDEEGGDADELIVPGSASQGSS